jgi:hypothetical protein
MSWRRYCQAMPPRLTLKVLTLGLDRYSKPMDKITNVKTFIVQALQQAQGLNYRRKKVYSTGPRLYGSSTKLKKVQCFNGFTQK